MMAPGTPRIQAMKYFIEVTPCPIVLQTSRRGRGGDRR
jgi:hypothetical protein